MPKEQERFTQPLELTFPDPGPSSREHHSPEFPHQPDPQTLLEAGIRCAVADYFEVDVEQIPPSKEAPSKVEADLGIPLFGLAKELRESPNSLATRAASGMDFEGSLVTQASGEGGFLNFQLDHAEYTESVLAYVEAHGSSYGAENVGQGKTAVIDMSSPNAARPMSVAHLRSTVNGESLARILEFRGYNVIKDNHVGDWGAQFGMLLKAYELWGGQTPELREEGKEVDGLFKLYVRIHEEVELEKAAKVAQLQAKVEAEGMGSVEGFKARYNRELTIADSRIPIEDREKTALQTAIKALSGETELERAGREWFLRLEQGDETAEEQWKWVLGLSMTEFESVYKMLGIDFDYALGESFYGKNMADIVTLVQSKEFAVEEDGAVIANLEAENLGKMVVQTKDGRSLYVTRDLATALFRKQVLGADELYYVVGGEQAHYFKQFFAILKKMGYEVGEHCEHIPFGMMSLPEGKMSTRRGNVVFLRDVLEEGISRAEALIQDKSPGLFADEVKRKEVARQVGVGAIIWSDLSQGRERNITFDWDKMLSFTGNAAPYVQYAHARARTIIEKAQEVIAPTLEEQVAFAPESPVETSLLKLIAEFPRVVGKAHEHREPSVVAEHVFKLAQGFSAFYENCPVLKGVDDRTARQRLRIVEAAAQTIKNGLYLLGIEAPEQM
ncbi:MAG: arginine--tRNA ligase [bacterium]|nr:arginine--tRNA ligase [bacterium]